MQYVAVDPSRNSRIAHHDFRRGIEEREPRVRAWAYIDASSCETASSSEWMNSPEAFPRSLVGVPLGVKDIIDVRGMPSRHGSKSYAHAAPAAMDAACVAMLKAAGAVVVGKTVTAEFAYAQPGPTCNPHHASHTPGGSSSGSAAAVAAGMVPVALGTQTGGSIIRPAAYCGVVGFKASLGAVSLSGIKPASESFDSLGWFTETVEASECVARVLLPSEPRSTLNPAATKVAVIDTAAGLPITSQAKTLLSHTMERLSQAGIDVRIVSPIATTQELHQLHRLIMIYEMSRNFATEWLQCSDALGPLTQAAMKQAEAISYSDYSQALDRLHTLRQEWRDCLSPYSVVLSHSAAGVAPATLSTTGDSSCNRVWSALGWAAVHLPIQFSGHGLPLGVQMTAPPRKDFELLTLARHFHTLIDCREAASPQRAAGPSS